MLTLEKPRSSRSMSIDELEARVQDQMHGRVRSLRLLWREPGLILQGQAATYYAKQLAQHTVMQLTGLPILANDIQVA